MWDVDCYIRKRKGSIPEVMNENRKTLFKDYPAACWVYCFEVVDLEELYNEKNGFIFRNSMYSIWLYYTTKAVLNVDKQLGDVIQEVHINEGLERDEEIEHLSEEIIPKPLPTEKNLDNLDVTRKLTQRNDSILGKNF